VAIVSAGHHSEDSPVKWSSSWGAGQVAEQMSKATDARAVVEAIEASLEDAC